MCSSRCPQMHTAVMLCLRPLLMCPPPLTGTGKHHSPLIPFWPVWLKYLVWPGGKPAICRHICTYNSLAFCCHTSGLGRLPNHSLQSGRCSESSASAVLQHGLRSSMCCSLLFWGCLKASLGGTLICRVNEKLQGEENAQCNQPGQQAGIWG